ncbi:hypothetical protein, partial [Pseudomonas aeruginosa]|uniref:hypothetical protein n=1 Tax=Pseudomonas aeruginosa TaxID=287 RepID=UPI00315FA528
LTPFVVCWRTVPALPEKPPSQLNDEFVMSGQDGCTLGRQVQGLAGVVKREGERLPAQAKGL